MTLSSCRHAEALVPRLGQIVRRGVGVNTRVGAARFISGLALRMGADMRPASGALIKVCRQPGARKLRGKRRRKSEKT